MRTTKFRAWDGKQMIYRGLHDRNWYSEDLGGGLVKGTHPDDQRLLSTMQFTGLKDKSGKDIYEGDILDSSEKVPLIFEVYYEDGGFRYGTKDRSVDISFSGHTWLKNILTRFHVIGNIFDNPELLS